MFRRCTNAFLLWTLCVCLWAITGVSHAQGVPNDDQLRQLLAPIALYPDTLLAQICAASGDPQQIIDADNWLNENNNLKGQSLIDAAQSKGFDPAIVALVTFPTVLDAMAKNVDDYAAIGAAFKANQGSVTAAIQALRQEAYAAGTLDSNDYQTVSVQNQNGAQVVVIQPANPQVVYVPQYVPQQVYVSGPAPGDVVAASLVTFGAGIAIGMLINNQPWGWHSWGWGWYGRGVYYAGGPWHPYYRYRSPYPPYRPRPPNYNRPGYGPGWGRPPPNWNQRPGYRPSPGGRPPGGHPPGNGGGSRPPGGGATGGGTTRPAPSNRPAPTARPAPAPSRNPYAGYPPKGGNGSQRPTSQPTGARPGALGGSSNGRTERAASSRGRASSGGGAGGRRR